ncbi:transmembrane and immunoglobulin domain-containing protein 1 [Poeciliopsis prolifica]|uniref:transmembrane and immunoglobulin domain-containing protein 1 n=1 Tax=Poeciliopsis prolifica TaxID=188132 RepID=UPI0024139AAE|nr:transmembrane and immunoglobulin domain-containing protein 1 [Poeciliopsis prolifica]XP_054899268.1 transmembrane and immunoglobulin domain-containing protein 1 [Poeciliopsis prolifica]
MKLMVGITLLFLLPFCASQTSVHIDSTPKPSTDGVIQTTTQSNVSLVCILTGAPKDEELVWLRNGAMVKLNDENKQSGSSVCISPVIQKDEGATFTCQLKSNSSHSASVTLNVTYCPDVSGSEEVTLEEEESLNLQCDMKANPLVTSVSWKLNGTMVDLSTGGFIISNDGINTKLYVKKADRSMHEGEYQCTVTSPICESLSKTFQVTVTDKTIKFPLMPMIAGLVVVGLTALLAIVSRWRMIARCFK